MANINVLAELDRYGLAYDFADNDEVKVKCPFHEDSSPSCHVHLEKTVFICRAANCAASGDIFDLLARHLRMTRKLVMLELGKRYQIVDERTIKSEVIEGYHARIWNAQPLLKELYKRGLDDADVRKYRLGEKDGRITIPIKNISGQFVNVRSYLPGAPGVDKMRNLKGRAKVLRLFPHDQLAYNRIVITGGEIKAIAAARRLNPHGIGAVTVTAGEGIWDPKLTDFFVGKQVFVVMDIDAAGRVAAENICKHLCKVTASIHDVLLPLDPTEHPKGDINDYVVGHTDAELYKLLDDWLPWVPTTTQKIYGTEDPEDVTLNKAYHADCIAKRVRVTATVSAVDTKSCAIAKKFVVNCTRDQDFCAICPVFPCKEDHEWSIHPESDSILKMALQPDYRQQDAIKEEIAIPRECRACKFAIKEYHNVENCLVSASLSITDTSREKELLPALIVGENIEMNEQYEFVGVPHPHPKDQTMHLVVSQYKTSLDALSTHQVTSPKDLLLFTPSSWTYQGVRDKFEDIAKDFESNVTLIRQRPEIHILTDLAYHSPLILDMGKDGLQRGWVQVLIVGDSAQGKSETVLKMSRHYGLGEKVVCKNASRAGLLGGIDQSLGGSFVTWGAIPTNDRRLVILEELKGASVDVIAQLTDMRDSGRAELQKIKKRRTNARTRIIALSNSRSGNQMAQYPYGITAIPELIGAAEDVRRFDACLVVDKNEVPPDVYNTPPDECPHRYTSTLCRELVLWAWTRHASTRFEPAAHRAILAYTNELTGQFTDEIPIIDRGSMRFKLARLSAAAAARTFSTDDDYEFVVVRKCHVDFVVEFLKEIYCRFAFGYDRYTKNKLASVELREPDKIRALLETQGDNAFLIEMLVENDRIRLNDVVDASGNSDVGWGRTFISFLVQRRALINKGSYYVKSAEFVKFLTQNSFKSAPDFMKPDF